MGQQKLSLVEAIKVVLKDAGQPLHVQELLQRITASGIWATVGKTPQDTISARLATDIKINGTASAFVRTAPNTYGLNDKVVSSSSSLAPQTAPSTDPSQPVVPQPNSVPSPSTTLSFTDAAEEVLNRSVGRQPLHYGDITKQARQHGLIQTLRKDTRGYDVRPNTDRD